MTHFIDSFPGRFVTVNNKKYLYFGGTSYLGLQTDTAFQKLYTTQIKKYGTSYGASRNSNVQFSIYEKAEYHLAALVGSEKAVTLSSGYLAGQLLCSHFISEKHPLFYAPNTHSALSQQTGSYFTSYQSLNTEVRRHIATKKTTPVVFIDSIDFNGSSYPDFVGLQTLPLKDIILVVDDSHGIGILGDKGGGVYQQLQKFTCKEIVVSCSLGKGFGIQAGAIYGNTSRITSIKNTAFFGGASPASPASIATYLFAQNIYAKKRATLQAHITLFNQAISQHASQFIAFPHHPTFGFQNIKLTKALEENNIITTHFNYPADSNTVMSRIVLSASHKKKDVTMVSSIINTLF